MIATINTLLRPAHLTAYSAGGMLVLAVILGAVFGRRGRRSEAPAREVPPKRGSVWAAFLAFGAVAAAFVLSQGKHAPAPPAAAPKPAPARTQIIHQVTTKIVSHSPLNGWEIVIIAVVLAGSCVAIWVNRRAS